MKNIVRNITVIALGAAMLTGFTSCEATKNANNKQKGAVIGATGGAILGAIIGNNAGKGGNGELGAVIGGVVGGGAGVLIGNKMDKQAQQIEQELPGATVERVDDGIVVTFDENSGVYFDTAKYNVNPASQTLLNKMSNIMKEYNQTNVIVAGHTDSVGSDVNNMTLSQNRANAVTNYMVSTGLSAGRFTTVWYGETQPAASNDTAEGRAQNRRVQLAIVPNEEMKQDAMKEANGGN